MRVVRPVLLVGILLVLHRCGGSGLPQAAEEALTATISELAGPAAEYQVVSALKASGPPGEVAVQVESPFDANPGACPANLGGEETWCVVLDRSLAGSAGEPISHFLVSRIGQAWQVEPLAGSARQMFFLVGCNNWDAAGGD